TTMTVPKHGAGDAECEDALAVRDSDDAITVAVADGATEGIFSRAWAHALVRAGVACDGSTRLASAVGRAHAAFQTAIEPQQAGLPWYAAQKAEEGAFAALLRIRVEAGGQWHAEAVGDVTLLVVRDASLAMSWPMSDATAFDHRPALVSSLAFASAEAQERSGAWSPGDTLLVATDALAAHLLRQPDAIAQLGTCARPEWEAFVADARRQGMRNDDVALVRLALRAP
ncbi:MAG: protein phosphatase 2C domain-containing protein, partial [Bacteroidota bacterium]